MNENIMKICRICLTEGSRNIFQRTVAHDALYNVSSLSRISEKLRYVTLLKIDEMENLPPMICDLCIVQLNVAYNFKRQASESDTKLRQYLIENGIDIMKDPLSLPASAAAAATSIPPIITSPPVGAPTPSVVASSILRPAIVAAPSRMNQRSHSTASSAVLEISSVVRGGTTLPQQQQQQHQHQLVVPHQLRPIRVKVETPETATERSSEGGDLLCNSDISPLSSVTSNAVPIPVQNGKGTTVVTVESSPASSKGSASERSNGAMVVVSSDNVSMHGDEDFVQNILGSNSSIATSKATEGDKQESVEVAATPEKANNSATESDGKKKDRLKTLLSKLSIDMVNSAKLPKSKFRTKPKKQINSETNSAIKKRKRNTLDYAQLLSKRTKPVQGSDDPDRRRNPVARRSANVISASKLRTLGEKIRAEKEMSSSPGGRKPNTDEPRRRRVFADSSTTVELVNGDGPSSTRASLP